MQQAIEGTVIPTNTEPTAVCSGGCQPSNEPMLTTEACKSAHDELNKTGENYSNTQDVGSGENFKEVQEKLDPQWLELVQHLIYSHHVVNEWADNLILMELAQKIVSKIRANERFVVYVVKPMWPEDDPKSGAIQEILYWQQRDTNRMNSENSELKLRLQTMEQQVHLQDGKIS
ncbi:hypothetical protein RJT34_16635 [Clitoria ternatea]|uniref:Uncharacterized protein n=1 Tax=Clitoria ternatea TaxID=43366 RepID=A0AAN9PDW2_CLITE